MKLVKLSWWFGLLVVNVRIGLIWLDPRADINPWICALAFAGAVYSGIRLGFQVFNSQVPRTQGVDVV